MQTKSKNVKLGQKIYTVISDCDAVAVYSTRKAAEEAAAKLLPKVTKRMKKLGILLSDGEAPIVWVDDGTPFRG